jgi:hypothetical protein
MRWTSPYTPQHTKKRGLSSIQRLLSLFRVPDYAEWLGMFGESRVLERIVLGIIRGL